MDRTRSFNESMRVALLAFLTLFQAANAFAQASVTGNVSGTVTDASNATVAEATIVLHNLNTNQTRTVTSTGTGTYEFLNIPIGPYEINTTKAGFADARARFEVTVQSAAVVNVTLQLGSVSTAVSVTSEAEVLNTTDATLSGLVTNQKVEDLPLNGRSFVDLLALQPGVTPIISTNSGRTSATRNDGGFIGGADDFYNDFTIDGGDYNDISVPGSLINKALIGNGVPPDAIAEFRVITGAADAEFGTVAGAHVNVVTKSGSNQFHGDAWEFYRNQSMDAKNFFDSTKLPFTLNQYGGVVGGPVVKDKHFFFASYEGYRQSLLATAVAVVPTPRLIAALPTTGNLRQLFQDFYPAPDAGYSSTALVAPYRATQNQGNDRDSFILREDSHVTNQDTISARVIYNNARGTPGVILSSGLPGGNAGFSWLSVVPEITYTRIISPTIVNEARINYNRSGLLSTGDSPSSSVTGLGYSTNSANANGLPYIVSSGTGLTSLGLVTSIPQGRESNVFQYTDTLGMTKGRLTIKIGFNAFRYQINSSGADTPRPTITFVGFGAPFDTSTTGLTTGTFLQQTQSFNLNPFDSSRRYVRFSLFAGFIQNTFKVNRKLSLDYGLRYEINTIPHEKYGVQDNLYQLDASGNALANTDIYDISHVALRPTSSLGYAKLNKNEWEPRVGLAWTPFDTGWMVFRAGYGLYYERPDLYNFYTGTGNPPFTVPTNLVQQSFGTVANPSNFLTQHFNASVYDPGNGPVSVQNFNANVQLKVEHNGYIQVGYAGSHTLHYNVVAQPNMGGAFTGTRPNPTLGTISLVQDIGSARYDSLQIEYNHRFGHGFTAQASYTYGNYVGVAEPGSTPTNLNNYNLDYGRMDSDIQQIFVANVVYDLPWGHGRALLTSGWLSRIAGGWSLTGILTTRSGLPFSILAGSDVNHDGNTTDRAFLVSGQNLSSLYASGTVKTQFLVPESAALNVLLSPSSGTLTPRNAFTGPSFVNLDLGLHRQFNITESKYFEVRGEFFNSLNHPNLGNPTNSLTSPLFGQILTVASNARQAQLGVKFYF